MTRPSDISQDVWDGLSEELKHIFSRDYNRSFINPVIEDIDKQIKKISDTNRRINSRGNELRSLTIGHVAKRDINDDQDMIQSQSQMIVNAQIILDSIVSSQEELNTLLDVVTSRIDYYKEIDNVS